MASKKGKKTAADDVIVLNDAEVGGDKSADEQESDKKQPANKGRGRPAKKVGETKKAEKTKIVDDGSEDDGGENDDDDKTSGEPKSKKSRGRPPKANKKVHVKVPGRGRGRPKKV